MDRRRTTHNQGNRNDRIQHAQPVAQPRGSDIKYIPCRVKQAVKHLASPKRIAVHRIDDGKHYAVKKRDGKHL